MEKNPFHHLGILGFAGGCEGGIGPDDLDISAEVLNELGLSAALVKALLVHGLATGLDAPLAKQARQFLGALKAEQSDRPPAIGSPPACPNGWTLCEIAPGELRVQAPDGRFAVVGESDPDDLSNLFACFAGAVHAQGRSALRESEASS